MFCAQCGKELPPNATACPACGFVSTGTDARPGPATETLEQILKETKRAAHELAQASARLSTRLVEKAQTAAREPKASAKRAAHQVAQELDAAAREIDRLLKEI